MDFGSTVDYVNMKKKIFKKKLLAPSADAYMLWGKTAVHLTEFLFLYRINSICPVYFSLEFSLYLLSTLYINSSEILL